MKLLKIKFVLIFIVVFVFASLAGAPLVFASVIAVQSSDVQISGELNGAGNEIFVQKLGTNLSGTLGYVSLTLARINPYTNPSINVNCFTSSAYSTPCSGSNVAAVSAAFVVTGGKTQYNVPVFSQTAPGTAQIVLDSSKYYTIQYTNGGGTKVYGSTSDLYAGGAVTTNGSNLNGLLDLAFVVSDSDGLLGVDNNIIAQLPANASTNVDANIAFSGIYNNDGSYNAVIIGLDDLTNSSQVNFQCASASVGTSVNYSCKHTGKISTSYQYRAFLCDTSASGFSFPFGCMVDSTLTFTTGTTLTPDGSSSAVCDLSHIGGCIQNAIYFLFLGTTGSNGITAKAQVLNSSLATHLPFAYAYDVTNVYNEIFANSGSQSYTVSVNTGVLGTFTFISPTLISAVPYASTIKTILSYIIYLMTAMLLYRMTLRVFNPQK